ncbi:hypothetical protein SAMN02745181_0299 [Rubritalea squalenifaciens DSM 18772]|uniref:DNA mimic protein DMP19 C-terminal domain-containing protein n=1 Tax=Rubritalea squalenifaciens DSM 18772 TaxID=1123071 RepID=A0A1M6BSU7_9BACT|nr:hypothetical protein [Rubritalea squalenifaciens]SHI51751.1 hypothetical protein SAMN02745181_0299 [Rubritalea squalenifaciens DSM 18772]
MSWNLEKVITTSDDFTLFSAVKDLAFDAYYADRNQVTPVQAVVIDAWCASGIIGGDGLWLGNYSRDDLKTWSESYKKLGMNQSAEVLLTAATILPDEDADETDELSKKLHSLETVYYEEDKTLSQVVARYIRDNPDQAIKKPEK